MNRVGGLILLNKPPGVTSFNALGSLKKELGTGKVGHTGTLDKFAEGLIVALSGKMTKLVPLFTGMDKEYEALIKFGEETDTLDPEGEIVSTASLPVYSVIEKNVGNFLGKIRQHPPVFSAIHINGKRAYERVRSGEEIEMPEREVEIFSFDLLDWNPPFLKVRVRCSKGTYIRSLARDLAVSCGSRARLQELKRISVGPFLLEQSVLPPDFQEIHHLIKPWDLFDFLPHINKYIVDNRFAADITTGKTGVLGSIGLKSHMDGEYALFSEDRKMLAQIKVNEGRFSYGFVC